jgi:hypothetical protein
MLDPASILKDANATVHDITYGDVQTMLELLKEQDGAAQAWEELVVFLTDDTDVKNCAHTELLVKEACSRKRAR